VERAAEISVVIPTLNRWPWLERSLRGALAQNDVSIEIAVVDDGSTDATGRMLRAPGDPRVRVLTHARPMGVAASRNHGIREARGEWIAFLDDDDLWAPDKLSVQLAAVRRTGADFAYCAAAHVHGDLRLIEIEPAPTPDSLADGLLSTNALPAGSSNIIIRRRTLIELGGFDESLFHLADWDLWLRLVQQANGVACDKVLVGYVKHSENMLGRNERDFFREFERFAAKHRDASRGAGRDIDRVGVARWVATTHRRAGRRGDAAAAYLRAVRFGDRRRSVGSLLRTLSARDPTIERARSAGAIAPQWLSGFREPRAPAS
jgi:glycosyltransferase involved in cell wall biosynthesis